MTGASLPGTDRNDRPIFSARVASNLGDGIALVAIPRLASLLTRA